MREIIDDIKNLINVEDLFNELEIEIINIVGEEIKIRCLNISHVDNNPSCFYNINSHIWNCLGCSYSGDIIDLVKIIKNINFMNAVKFLVNFSGIVIEEPNDEVLIDKLNFKNENVIDNHDDLMEVELPYEFDDNLNNANDDIQKYFIKRRINRLIMKRYSIGFCNEGYYRNRIIIPIVFLDRVVSFVARYVLDEDEEKPRYIFPKGSNINDMIWGIVDGYNRRNPIFTEGIFDAIRLRVYGYNSFSTLNNQLSDVQVKLIFNYFDGNIYIIPDNDAGGLIMKNAFLRKIIHKRMVYVIEIKRDKCDPDGITKEEMCGYYKNIKLITDL